MPVVSVIMPVYNSVKYLTDAVNSVRNQSFPDFELILIDDGSTDGSGYLCDQFAKTDSRIVSLHKENGGICSARNAGLDHAKGLYIGFIDNDDTYERDLLKEAYTIAVNESVDCVRFSRRRISTLKTGKQTIDTYGVKNLAAENQLLILRDEHLWSSYRAVKQSGALNGIWNGLFRKEIIDANHIRFDTSIRCGGEDWLFNIQFFEKSGGYAFLGKELYIYNRRELQSASTSYNFNRIEAIIKVCEYEQIMINRLKLKNSDNLLKLYLYLLYTNECARILGHQKCNMKLSERVKILKDLKSAVLKDEPDRIKKYLILQNRPRIKGLVYLLLHTNLYALYLHIYKLRDRIFGVC